MVLYSCPQLSCPTLKHMYDSKICADVQLCAGENGRRIFAHKDVLSSATEYFKRMFRSSFRESIESIVVIQDMDSDTLEAVIQFIYCGTVEISSFENAIELLTSAHLMELPELIKFSEEYLLEIMSAEISLQAYLLSKVFKMDNLFDSAKAMIGKKFKIISQGDEFRLLDANSFAKIIIEIQNLARVKDIAEGILAWVGFQESRQSNYEEFLQFLENETAIRDDTIKKLIEYSADQNEFDKVKTALMNRNCSSRTVKDSDLKFRTQKLLAFIKAKDYGASYAGFEYDFTHKTLLKRTTITMENDVLGVWDNRILFKKGNEIYIENFNNQRSSSHTLKEHPKGSSVKIGEDAYILCIKTLYKLNLINNSLEEIALPEQFQCYNLDAMCEFNGELKIMAYIPNKHRWVEILTYMPLHRQWDVEPSVSKIKHVFFSSLTNFNSIAESHKRCLYYFQHETLHVYDLENKIWQSIFVQYDLYVQHLKFVVSVNDQLIVWCDNGIFEYIPDQAKLNKANFLDCRISDPKKYMGRL